MNEHSKWFFGMMGGLTALIIILMFTTRPAQAAEQQLVCQNYGYTDKAEDFHSIKTLPLVSTFKLEGSDVVFGDDVFKSVNPEMVGLEGLAITYYLDTEEKILYFYTNDEGQREVGISHVEKDSDTVFGDKSVFTNCAFEEPRKQQIAGTVVRTNNTSGTKFPVFTF